LGTGGGGLLPDALPVDDDDDGDDESIKLMFACCYSYKQAQVC